MLALLLCIIKKYHTTSTYCSFNFTIDTFWVCLVARLGRACQYIWSALTIHGLAPWVAARRALSFGSCVFRWVMSALFWSYHTLKKNALLLSASSHCSGLLPSRFERQVQKRFSWKQQCAGIFCQLVTCLFNANWVFFWKINSLPLKARKYH